MKRWLRRIRGAIGRGLTWAVAWALVGLLIGVSSILLPFLPWHLFFEVFDAPLPALAMPAFVGGVLFSLVLGVAGRRRRFDELSLPRFAAWGATGGLLLALVPPAMVATGLASMNPGAALGPWQLTAAMAVPCMLLGAASAGGSLALARRAQSRAQLDVGQRVAELERAQAEARELLGVRP